MILSIVDIWGKVKFKTFPSMEDAEKWAREEIKGGHKYFPHAGFTVRYYQVLDTHIEKVIIK